MKETLIPILDHRIQSFAQRGDRGLGKRSPAQFFCDLGDLAGRHSVYDHFHEGQYQSLFAPLIALKEFGGKFPIPCLRHAQGQPSHPSRQLAGIIPFR